MQENNEKKLFLNSHSLINFQLRTVDDIINLEEAEEFGYKLINDNNDFFQFDDEEEEDFDDFIDMDEDLLINFLNEYYIVNPTKLPKTEIL